MKYLFIFLLFFSASLCAKDNFEQEAYKKLITDLKIKEIVDEQLNVFGLKPTDENRIAFLSIISKDLQENLQKNVKLKFKSFYGDGSGYNQAGIQSQEMLAYQTEMTRTLTALLQSVNSKINKSVGVKKKYVILSVLLAFIASELGFFKKFIGMSHFYMENKEKAIKKLDAFGNWIKQKIAPVTSKVVWMDNLSDKPEAKKFLDAWDRFSTEIKDQEDWQDIICSAERIEVINSKNKKIRFWVDKEAKKREEEKEKARK